MTTRHAALLLPALAASMLSACTNRDTSRYPSLAVRDAERISGSAQPVQPDPGPPPPVAASADLVTRLSQLRQQAERSHQDFTSALGQTRSLVNAAAGSPIASESWSVAQAALAQLQAKANPAHIALADLDRLYVDSEMEEGAVEAIAAQRDIVLALVAEEEEAISALTSRLAD